VISDAHYPICKLSLIRKIISKEKPDNVVLLGDNIELSMFKEHLLAYKHFFRDFNRIFPIKKSIIMLGDNDCPFADRKEITKLVESYSPMNGSGGKLFFFKIGAINFFHGNLEKSAAVEKIGYHFVLNANKISYKIAPKILSALIRFHFNIAKEEYLFMGHLHFLGVIKNNVFCGTLNKEFTPFPDSLGYVTLVHENFIPVKSSIKLVHVDKKA
ncbi:MAG: hypothetical protein ACP5FN_01245, partial [Candidatus Micrarchaeia archaeon]